MTAMLLTLGTLALSIVSFVLGRIYAESERILAEKRRVYERFLLALPAPMAAYDDVPDEANLLAQAQELMPAFLLYASGGAAQAVTVYYNKFQRASEGSCQVNRMRARDAGCRMV